MIKTRFTEETGIKIGRVDGVGWCHYDCNDRTPAKVGPWYFSKAELLSDHENYLVAGGWLKPAVCAASVDASNGSGSELTSGMVVSLDGGQTWAPVTNGVHVICQTDVWSDAIGDAIDAELHLNLTSEGLIGDVYCASNDGRSGEKDVHEGTFCSGIDDLVGLCA